MRAWRLAPSRYPPFDGEGARLFGGRWNSPGVPLVYLADSLALAVLETLVHLGREHLPDDLLAHRVELPDETMEALETVPADWLADPLRRQTRRFGDAWVREERSLALRVPSAVIPQEFNLLLNPRHPRAGELRTVDEHPFTLDPRLSPTQLPL
jgi:RES domain-containing protein